MTAPAKPDQNGVCLEPVGCELEAAMERYRALMEEVGVPLILAGDARRLRPYVSGLVVLAPWVPARSAELGDDIVLIELTRLVSMGGLGTLEGLEPGFRRARFAMRRVRSGKEIAPVALTVARFDPGQLGNYGLCLLRETGPEDFTMAFYAACRDRGVRSEGGALFRGASPVATPTEESAFEAAGLPWVSPGSRTARHLERLVRERAA